MQPLVILLVEGHREVRKLIVGWLTEQGHRVTGVATPQEALGEFQAGTFQLAITHLMTKEGQISGIELIKQLRQLDPQIKSVLTSSSTEELEYYEQTAPEHTDATYSKGDNQQKFAAAIEKAMSGAPR